MAGLTGEFLDVWQGKELENRGQGIGGRLGRGLGRKWAVFSGMVIGGRNNGEESFGFRWPLRMRNLCRMRRPARMGGGKHIK